MSPPTSPAPSLPLLLYSSNISSHTPLTSRRAGAEEAAGAGFASPSLTVLELEANGQTALPPLHPRATVLTALLASYNRLGAAPRMLDHLEAEYGFLPPNQRPRGPRIPLSSSPLSSRGALSLTVLQAHPPRPISGNLG